MKDDSFNHASPLREGRIVFDVRNQGRKKHELVLSRLPDDFSGTLDAQFRAPTRFVVPTLAVVAPIEPMQRQVFAADLPEGKYALVCFLEDFDGPHHLKGMNSQLMVTATET